VRFFFLIDPLILVATWLAAHAVPQAALWALATIALTVVFGRVFCGWVCPLGTVHALASRLLRRKADHKRRDHWSRWQLTKYYLLAGLLAGAVFGLHWACLFDPLVWLTRSTVTALLPGAQWAVEEGSTAIYQADPGIGWLRLTAVSEPIYGFFRDHVFAVPKQAFLGGWIMLALFVAAVLANAYRPRFWCRYLCPLGALLGVFAWRPLVRRKLESESCNHCDVCAMACHGAATEAPGDQWKAAECFGCMNCTKSCRRDSLRFGLVLPWRRDIGEDRVDLSKRALLGAAVGGVVLVSGVRISPQGRGRTFHPALIRPPGSLPEAEFLRRCTSCGLCMKACPTGGLQPSVFEAGLEGLWTPRLVPQVGYCDYNCVLCSQVCPTGAIEPLTLEKKRTIKMGLAAFDVTRCIPYAYGRDCMVCEEHCPVPEKAIYSLEVEVQDRKGQPKKIKRPYVDPDKCTGCGVCENVCPYRDRPGIRVSSANETRNPDNQPILPGGEDDPYA
jgi:MauM/NapG family ferredoxin protein